MLSSVTIRSLSSLKQSHSSLGLGLAACQRVQVRFDSSGIVGSAAQVKSPEISPGVRRHERVSEILAKVKRRDGLPRLPSHVEHLVGRVSASTPDDQSDMPVLDIAEKTHFVMQSTHPVKHVLEREIFNHNKESTSYHDWLTLFGRGIRISKNPKYDDILSCIAKSSDSGTFSSEIHQSVVDIPDDYKPEDLHMQYTLGNKYAALVGDYFAIRCIYFIEKTKNSKALMAVTKGLEEFTTAHFAVRLIDPKVIYPVIPHKNASLDEWILYNKKCSGYFTGGLYAILVVNYDGLPKSEKVLRNLNAFVSNLAVLLKGVAEMEAFENAHQFSTISPLILTSLPAILYQKKDPKVFDTLRKSEIQLQGDIFKRITEEVERNAPFDEVKFILGEIAAETKRNVGEITKDPFYADIIQDLVDAVASFD